MGDGFGSPSASGNDSVGPEFWNVQPGVLREKSSVFPEPGSHQSAAVFFGGAAAREASPLRFDVCGRVVLLKTLCEIIEIHRSEVSTHGINHLNLVFGLNIAILWPSMKPT